MPVKISNFKHPSNAFQFFQPKEGVIRTYNIAFDEYGTPDIKEIFLGYKGECGVTRINFNTTALKWNDLKYTDIANTVTAALEVRWIKNEELEKPEPVEPVDETEIKDEQIEPYNVLIGEDNSFVVDLSNVPNNCTKVEINYFLQEKSNALNSFKFVANTITGVIKVDEVFEAEKTTIPSKNMYGNNDFLINRVTDVQYDSKNDILIVSDPVIGANKEHCVSEIYLNDFYNHMLDLEDVEISAIVEHSKGEDEEVERFKIKTFQGENIDNEVVRKLWIDDSMSSLTITRIGFMFNKENIYGWYGWIEAAIEENGYQGIESDNAEKLLDAHEKETGLKTTTDNLEDLVWGED